MAHLIQRSALSLAIIVASTTIHGQALEQQDLLAPIGSTWAVRSLQTIPDEQPLEWPVVWSYSDLVSNGVFGAQYTIVAPDDAPGHDQFPGATRVVHEVPTQSPNEDTWTFFSEQQGTSHQLGSFGPVVDIRYLVPALTSSFPLEEGMAVQATFCYNAATPSGETYHCGTTRIEHTTKGRLELPYGTFDPAHLVTTRWAIGNNSSGTDSTRVVHMEWYVDRTPYPILKFTKYTFPDGSTSRSGQLLEESSIVAVQERSLESIRIHPVPTQGQLNVGLDPGDTNLQIFSNDGRSMRSESLTNAQERIVLDLSAYPAGVYHLMISNAKGVRHARAIRSN